MLQTLAARARPLGGVLSGIVEGAPSVTDASRPVDSSIGLDTSPLEGMMPSRSERGSVPDKGRPDYAAMLSQAIGQRPELHGARKWAAILGPALMAATGNQAGAQAAIEAVASPGREWDARNREAALTAVKWQRDDLLSERERNQPKFLSGNVDQVRYDPATGEASRIYDAPDSFETYASAQGLQPGTEDYFRAVEDFVLRGNGPTAFKYDQDLATLRGVIQRQQEALRQTNRLGLIDYKNQHPAPSRVGGGGSSRDRIVSVRTPAEARALPKGTKFRTPDGKIKVVP